MLHMIKKSNILKLYIMLGGNDMGVFEMFNDTLNDKVEGVLEAYKKNLPKMSDECVLRKLEETEFDTRCTSEKVYEMTYREAKRRGLI